MFEKINKVFKWKKSDYIKAALGTLIFCIALNVFIMPNGLYNGGILGLSELLRTIINKTFGIHTSFDYSGIINFLINVPLFVLAYKRISKTFFARTVYCVVIQTIFLSIIPIPSEIIVKELITSVMIGGILAGVGCGLTLSSAASGGGTDIIGIILSQKNGKLSVGKVGLACNLIIYVSSGLMHGLEIMIYSIIYAAIESLLIEKTHDQNVCSTAMIFTKKHPKAIRQFIDKELNRGCTTWVSGGGFLKKVTYITYVACSRHELQKLERHIPELDPNAFLVKSDGVGIDGNFKKILDN